MIRTFVTLCGLPSRTSDFSVSKSVQFLIISMTLFVLTTDFTLFMIIRTGWRVEYSVRRVTMGGRIVFYRGCRWFPHFRGTSIGFWESKKDVANKGGGRWLHHPSSKANTQKKPRSKMARAADRNRTIEQTNHPNQPTNKPALGLGNPNTNLLSIMAEAQRCHQFS